MLDELKEHRLLAIIRGDDPVADERTALTLIDAGVRMLEISLTSADALRVLEKVATQAAGASIGAGTVLTAEDARRAKDAGATYAVTPALGEGVNAALELGLPVLAGAMTPTEVQAAHVAGATAVKLFPAEHLGPSYLAALRGPFPDLAFVPVGGVTLEDVPPYLAAGAVAVGVGSPLTSHNGDLTALRHRATTYLHATTP
ncbi:bifunctional 4-hydroxy-2-oxoglutarate aldolase/2-dehydro-3-deoxy-phosphogluconate aldolase [Saccharothrix sp. AJ9571]|nr:bifunctional 4-hydroxy-2-oxoglutarate aldolase/2-dehydro-3-deoxy-phosphogluconate aldolase [Saccharothrix sp. AJ9571]